MKNSIKSTFGLRHEADVMSNRSAALKYAAFCLTPHEVILGDGGKFWVVCFADAQILTKTGYEIAK